MKPLAEIIERLLEAGYTEEQIAAVAGIHQSTVNRLRHGVLADPRQSVYVAIADEWRRHSGDRVSP